MNSAHIPPATVHESWASAFIDGETSLSDQTDWSDTVHEQLYYYTVTRQVMRGETVIPVRQACFETQRAVWLQFWARVDRA